MLLPGISCREIVRTALARLWTKKKKTASPSTSAYCQARKRIPVPWLVSIWRDLTERIENAAPADQCWMDREVIVIDGSGFSMPDTPANQKAYPQSWRQKPSCGFPTARWIAAFSLATGAMVEAAWDALRVHERTLFHRIWDRFQDGAVILADRGFCGYADFWVLLQRGIDSVMRKHQRRTKGVREVRRLNKNDRIVQWIKTKAPISWMSSNEWLAMPETLTVREVSFTVDIPGFRTRRITVATTLLDAAQYPASDLVELYRRRWMAELFLRDIKISMGMDVLRCKSPEMVERELWIHLIAYNLVRALMLQAALKKGAPLFRISLTGAIATIRQWEPVIGAIVGVRKIRQILRTILEYIVRDQVPHRPDRSEPRAIKRRKKNYQLLNKPRADFKEIRHRNKYKKSLS